MGKKERTTRRVTVLKDVLTADIIVERRSVLELERKMAPIAAVAAAAPSLT